MHTRITHPGVRACVISGVLACLLAPIHPIILIDDDTEAESWRNTGSGNVTRRRLDTRDDDVIHGMFLLEYRAMTASRRQVIRNADVTNQALCYRYN